MSGSDQVDLLARLREPDKRTLPFGPLGLGGDLRPEVAARVQAASIEDARLVDEVPEGIREYFERVRLLHVYGVLEYEFFSAACDMSLLAIEGALRRRFVDYYDGRIPVVKTKAGVQETTELHASSFNDVWHAARKWRLGPLADGRSVPLPTSLDSLLAWARREGLLPGRRTRGVDDALVNLREWAAHPSDYSLHMPPDSTRSLCQAAAYINALWGRDDLPAGNLFTRRIARYPRVIGIAGDGSRSIELRLDQVAELDADDRLFEFGVFLAPLAEDLTTYSRGETAGIEVAWRPGFQETSLPCERLFRGSWDELTAAIRDGLFAGCEDTVEHLDRVFLLHEVDSEVEHARAPDDLVALDERIEGGHWLAIVADSPWDAWIHASRHRSIELDEDGSCPDCYVAVLEEFDDWQAVHEFARQQMASGSTT